MRLSTVSVLMPFVLGAFAACTSVGGGSGPYVADNGRTVYPGATRGQFEVIAVAGDGPQEFFCAAGDYARMRLGADSGDRVLVTRAAGPSLRRSGARSVGFELRPFGADVPEQDLGDIIIRLNQPGAHRSVANSIFFCEDG